MDMTLILAIIIDCIIGCWVIYMLAQYKNKFKEPSSKPDKLPKAKRGIACCCGIRVNGFQQLRDHQSGIFCPLNNQFTDGNTHERLRAMRPRFGGYNYYSPLAPKPR